MRDVMPVGQAIKLGANVVYGINDTPVLPGDTSYDSKTIMDIAGRSALGMFVDEVAYESSHCFPNSDKVQVYIIQCTYAEDADTFQIHPALIRINMSYGHMRAADTINPVPTCANRCYCIADDITRLRRILFEFEKRVIYGLGAIYGPGDPKISVPMLRWGKGMLNLLVHERERLGGVIPQDVYDSCLNFEEHTVDIAKYIAGAPTSPYQAIPPVPADPNVANYIPANKTLLQEENAPVLSLSVPPWLATYIILGGAKFLIPSQQEAVALGFPPFPSVQTVPKNSIAHLASVPWEGTLIQERTSTSVYVIRNCQKCQVSSYNPASVLTAPLGSLASIPTGPPVTS